MRDVALGGGNADGIAGYAQHTDEKEHQHHHRHRRVEVSALQHGDGDVYGKRDGILVFPGYLHLVVEQAAQRTAHQQRAPHKGVYVLAVFKRALEIGQRNDLRCAAGQRAESEVARHRQQALFSQQILDALLNIQQQLTSGTLLLRHVLLSLFDIALLCSDLRLSDGRDEEAHGVGRQQRRDADLIVGEGGHGDHHRRQRLQHAGDGVGLGVVALCDKHRVEALVGHHINTVDRADNQTAHHQHRKIEPAPAEDQRRRQKYPR